MNGTFTNDTLVFVIIPSVSIRELFRKTLPDFGKSPDKNAAALSYRQISYLPTESSPDILLVSQRELTAMTRNQIICHISQKQYLYVAHHGSLEKSDCTFFHTLHTKYDHVVYQDFNRTEADPFYNVLKKLPSCFEDDATTKVYSQTLRDLHRCFNVNWQLEKQLEQAHQLNLPAQTIRIPKDALVLWNPNEFAGALQQIVGRENVAVSPEEFALKCKGKKKLLILAELAWRYRKLSQFSGYELAKDLVAKKSEIDIAFISFLERKGLKASTPAARLLAPIFPHVQMPFEGELKIPAFSATKWNIIRQYYLKPDGIVDKLLHDLKKLNKRSGIPRVVDTLERVQTYAPILPEEATRAAERARDLLESDADAAFQEVKELQHLLEKHYHHVISPDRAMAGRVPYQVMLVEDDSDTLAAVENGLRDYFKTVECFTDGARALEKLTKNHRSYSALIIDMGLLDAEGNWQPVQGYDLIEKAKDYPHLVIFMLTVYSKRALSNIHGSMGFGDIHYLAKDPVRGLPQDRTYSAFAEKLQSLIQARNKFLRGPKFGIWNKGMLQFYYKTLETKEGEKLWGEVIACVDEFIANEEQNNAEIVPKTLFHVETRDFKIQHLKTVLIHRLICLHRQYREHEIFFEKGIKTSIGFKMSSAKSYFNTLLGFSANNIKTNTESDSWKIRKRNLFDQEYEWLKRKFPRDATVSFPKVIEAFSDAWDYVPAIKRNQLTGFPQSVDSLDDCLAMLKCLPRLPRHTQQDVYEDLLFYAENYPQEFESLRQHEIGRIVARGIDDFLGMVS
jgi:CheY-like chemotaxis protein